MLDIETLKKELDDDQFAAVTAPFGNMLCIANAGSGKTRVLTYRIAYLISQGEPESSFLMLTFTVKAANEMMHRIQKLLGKSRLQITGGTFHSVANTFVRKFAHLLGYKKNISILDAQDSSDLMGLARMYYCAFHNIDTRDVPPKGDISSAYSYCRNTGQNFREYIQNTYKDLIEAQEKAGTADKGWTNIEAIEGIVGEYERRKRFANEMDFDDLLMSFDRLLDFPAVQNYIHQTLPNVFVDEFQDINVVQDSIIRKLTDTVNRLTAVGDDAQCIYGFRGSEVQFIRGFQETFQGAAIYPIRNNYRSTDKIVDLALAVINEGNNPPKEMNAMTTSPRMPYLKDCFSESERADYIVRQIEKAHAKGVPYDEIAILCRLNRLPRTIEVALTNAKIPVCMECGIPFYERAHIRHVLDFLKFLDNSRKQTAFWNLVEMAYGIGPKTARTMFDWFEKQNFEISMLSAMKVPRRSSASFAILAKTILNGHETLQNFEPPEVQDENTARQSLLQTLTGIFCNKWLYSWMEGEYKGGDLKSRRTDIQTLMTALKDYDDIGSFLETVALMDDKKDENSDGKVKITTIHRAKGLEWDKVFIPYLNDQILPHIRRRGITDEEIEEERRLCYVAITRGRKEVDIIQVASIEGMWNFEGNPSPFMTGNAVGKYLMQ